MALAKDIIARINMLMIWRVALGMSLLASIVLACVLWFSGGDETEMAFADGRRLVVALDTGKIEGKVVAAADLTQPAAPAASETPAAPVPATSTEPATPPVTPVEPAAQAVPATPAETPASATPPVAPAAPVEAPPAETPPPAAPSETTTPEVTPGAEAPPAVPIEQPPEASAIPEVALPEVVAPATPAAPETTAPAEVVPPPAELGAPVPPEGAATSTDPVSPMPPEYKESPALPADQSSGPSVLPQLAPTAPLLNEPAPSIQPSAYKLRSTNASITETVNEGTIPVVGSDGTKAWRYYAKPFERNGNQPMVAIIVTGLGQNRAVTDHALAMDENITLSFSPYVINTEQLAASARLAGHEVLIDLPLEPANYPASDPGPRALLIEKPPEENETRLRWLMSRITTSIGFVTPPNDRFTDNPEQFKLLMQSLGNRGLMLVITRDTSKDASKDVLANSGIANVVADFVIDEDPSAATIQSRLIALQELAVKRGYAVGIARSYPVSMQQLQEWLKTIPGKGFVLVPISAIARLDYS